MKISRKEVERRTDAALAEGRYRIMSRYTAASGNEMVNLSFCDAGGGPCDICGADKPGGEGCFSMLVRAARLGRRP